MAPSIDDLAGNVPTSARVEKISELVKPSSNLAESVTTVGEGGKVTGDMVSNAEKIKNIIDDLPFLK